MSFRVLLGFAPFAAFALIEKLVGIVPGLVAGLLVSLALVAEETLRRRRSLNLLEAGSAVIFGGLAILAWRAHRAWSVWEVRLYVDGGLALVVFLSALLRRPFTLQAARRAVSPGIARSQGFMRHNAILSAGWGAAFAGLAVVDLYMTTDHGAPDRRGIIATLLILAAAVKFTTWYVKRLRSSV